jgi:hypothetical protein
MAFKEDALLWLLQQDKDIIGVTYSTRRAPFLLVHHNLEYANDQIYGAYDSDIRRLMLEHGSYPVAALPCGFMLIKMDVFKKLPKPWFVTDCREELGEDVFFCRSARAAGYEVWLDVDLSRAVRHCGQHYYSIDDAKPADLQGHYLP